MNVEQAYTGWAEQYDDNDNRTRDLEATSLRTLLADVTFANCLEMGCGTGKNTVWLAKRAERLTAVDLTEAMLQKAKEKITAGHVQFVQGNMLDDWHFAGSGHNLITFSLVLEHIEKLQPVMDKAAAALAPGGWVYLGELHPFKQYTGSKARYQTVTGTEVVTCFNHHITDFTGAARLAGLQLVRLEEFFDNDDRTGLPRILAMLFQKPI